MKISSLHPRDKNMRGPTNYGPTSCAQALYEWALTMRSGNWLLPETGSRIF